MRLTTTRHGEHHVTIPDHRRLRVGTLSGILGALAAHFGASRSEIVARLFRDP